MTTKPNTKRTTPTHGGFSLAVKSPEPSRYSQSLSITCLDRTIKFPHKVELKQYEFTEAAIAGALRVARVIYEDRPETHGSDRATMWSRHPEACCAERAVAIALNRCWNGVGDDIGRTPDIGYNVEVRWTGRGGLILHDSDPKTSAFFAVTGSLGTYKIRGWFLGSEGIRPLWWNKTLPRHAYYIPFRKLHHSITIPRRTLMSGST